MVDLEILINLKKRERRMRGALHAISKSEAAVAYGFQSDRLVGGHLAKEPTGIAFLMQGRRKAVWKYASFDLLGQVARDCVAETIPGNKVEVSRGKERWVIGAYEWNWIVGAQDKAERLGERHKANEPFIHRLEQAEIGTITLTQDPQLYEGGKGKSKKAKVFWNVSAKDLRSDMIKNVEEVVSKEVNRLAAAESHKFHSNPGRQLPVQVSSDPYYKRVGD